MDSVEKSSARTVLISIRYLLPLLTLNFATLTWAGITEPVTTEDITLFIGCLVGAVVVELLILEIIFRFLCSERLTLSLAAVFAAFNLFSTNLILATDFLNASRSLQLLVLSGFCALFVLIFWLATRRRAFLQTGAFIASLFVLINLSQRLSSDENISRDESSSQSAMTASSKVRQVKFKRTPNVYLIGWESAAPRSLLEKYMQLETAHLHQAFLDQGFNLFRNVFAEERGTLRSWNILLSLHRAYATKLGLGSRKLFSGVEKSPLIDIFRFNGYEVTTAYENDYLGGARKGPYIDQYIVRLNFDPCYWTFLNPERRPWLFFGACNFKPAVYLPHDGNSPPLSTLLLRHVSAKTNSKNPQLVIAQMPEGMHVFGHWQGSPDQVARFRAGYVYWNKKAAETFNNLVSGIKSLDPSALILSFGDHGPMLSAHISYVEDPKFFVQDHFGILAGIWPPDGCSREGGDLKYHHTLPELARMVIKCLADGEDPIAEPYSHSIYVGDSPIDPKDYIYE